MRSLAGAKLAPAPKVWPWVRRKHHHQAALEAAKTLPPPPPPPPPPTGCVIAGAPKMGPLTGVRAAQIIRLPGWLAGRPPPPPPVPHPLGAQFARRQIDSLLRPGHFNIISARGLSAAHSSLSSEVGAEFGPGARGRLGVISAPRRRAQACVGRTWRSRLARPGAQSCRAID